MKVEILHVPDCPNVAVLEQRLRRAYSGEADALDMVHRVVPDLETAVAVGMTGSPTLLVDGLDPFADHGLEPSVSCRLYPDETGHMAGTPSVDALRRVLGDDSRHDEIDDQCGNCCGSPTAGAASLRTTRRRSAPADSVERATHRAILRAFAATGRPPELTKLDARVLGRLHDADVIRLGPDGRIRVAYPFSAVPTRHRVQLPSGVEVHAMCAIDALGLPAMLGVDATIATTDPVTGQSITVTVAARQSTWEPPGAVVFVSAQAGAGPSADTCCAQLNMFTSLETAEQWARTHGVAGEILNQVDAEQLGRQNFGDLLT
ncbi:alkylmercury lyase family protein [Actinophytocola sp.]|uniref:alkylmercury lyase family protein n=1 Tax=Actinophytocola sp. TaxID=1872138 RepID=UPI003D6B0602